MQNKFFSLIIPVYNPNLQQFEQTILSIKGQGMDNSIELVIIDDASPEKGYKQILDKYYPDNYVLKVLEENKGVGGSRQVGIETSTGDWISFIDQDDLLAENVLCLAKRDIENSGCTFVFHTILNVEYTATGAVQQLNYAKNLGWLHGKFYNREELLKRGVHFHPTARASEDIYFATLVNIECQQDPDAQHVSIEGQYVGYRWLILGDSTSHKMDETGHSYLERTYDDCVMVWKDSILWGWRKYHNFENILNLLINNAACSYGYVILEQNLLETKSNEGGKYWKEMYEKSTQWIHEVCNEMGLEYDKLREYIYGEKRAVFFNVLCSIAQLNDFCMIPTITFDDWFYQKIE